MYTPTISFPPGSDNIFIYYWNMLCIFCAWFYLLLFVGIFCYSWFRNGADEASKIPDSFSFAYAMFLFCNIQIIWLERLRGWVYLFICLFSFSKRCSQVVQFQEENGNDEFRYTLAGGMMSYAIQCKCSGRWVLHGLSHNCIPKLQVIWVGNCIGSISPSKTFYSHFFSAASLCRFSFS
jgi:hypothetical protein